MLQIAFYVVIGFASIGVAGACTCVSVVPTTATSQMKDATLVFRGTPLEIKLLPEHPKMRGRQRYAITFRVDQFWKGSPGQTVTVYDFSPANGACDGFGYKVGKEYLVYASQEGARDFIDKADDYFVWGWTDVLAPGTPMLQPVTCTLGGETADGQQADVLRELGPGRTPGSKP